MTMKKYRVRQGSIADHGRIVLIGIIFWAMLLGTAVSAYPM